ncbi:MAG: magnesium chelatase [Ignavibacteria bacterium]|jgi:magnesium chelatase subunit I
MKINKINTLRELKESNYKPRSIKDEMRENLISSLKNNINPFDGIIGYDNTVIPELQTAILSRHNIILLGLRGQAKTKIARMMTRLLDEYIPVIEGSELNEDPFIPLSAVSKKILEVEGDDTKITWMHRDERYTEKLATPDVTVADLIGDVDPIKAAALKLPYSDERVIHFGLVPRSHRSIFVMNELPDLQARIQVALFNILEERDIQIRGFKIRLPLDMQFIFTANPEDYTNRGSIVTPLKDRIDSQILTHYPKNIEHGRQITEQEADITKDQQQTISSTELLKNLVEMIAFEARGSEYIDEKSGVSARLTISAYENLISTAERRNLINNEKNTQLRISDLFGIFPSITGKIELVYEGEQEGPYKVAQILIGKAIKKCFGQFFPSPEKLKKAETESPYQPIIKWFKKGNKVELLSELSNKDYKKTLQSVPGLRDIVSRHIADTHPDNDLLLMEFILFGLAEHSLLSRHNIDNGIQFKDMLSTMFSSADTDFDLDDPEQFA